MIHVTIHAAARYVERINPALTPDEARAAIERSAPAIETAARFGCATVIKDRAKFVLDGERVITVLCRQQMAVHNFPREIFR